jgi:pimeloyl-ACP methyl ester carboxylesterase
MHAAGLEPTFHAVDNDGITINVAVAGDPEDRSRPLIVCVHGWPELWYSWRHQMAHFSAPENGGYTVAALDVRGYGGSSAPDPIEAYTLTQLCGDVAAVIDQLGHGPAVVVGHDWGAPIAWNTARLHPDRVRAVCGLSVPYFPTGPDNPLDTWRALYTDQGKFFYQVYFQDEGVAEAELGADTLTSIRKVYYAASGEGMAQPQRSFLSAKPADATLLDGMADPDPFPAWASPADLQVFADGIDRNGWRGPLNRYRAQPLDAVEIGAPGADVPPPNLTQPAAFIGGELDVVRAFAEGVDPYDFAALACEDFRGTTVVPGAGHWVQQEKPDEVNQALAAFLGGLEA